MRTFNRAISTVGQLLPYVVSIDFWQYKVEVELCGVFLLRRKGSRYVASTWQR